jgi:hypothetical protein
MRKLSAVRFRMNSSWEDSSTETRELENSTSEFLTANSTETVELTIPCADSFRFSESLISSSNPLPSRGSPSFLIVLARDLYWTLPRVFCIQSTSSLLSSSYILRGSLVVKALCYNPESRRLENRRGNQFFFSIYPILSVALEPGVYSVSKRNTETQKLWLWGAERGRCLGLTTLPPSVSRLPRQCEIFNISQPYRPPKPATGIATIYGDGVCFLWGTNCTVSTATSSQYLAVNCEPII